MVGYSKSPTFNLQVVLRETGLKPDTLRAWERRYGLPMPERTEGGHRLYSQYDIETIKWLIARQDEGMRINRAVDMWHSMVSAGQEPLDEKPIRDLAFEKVIPEPIAGSNLDELRNKWISACMVYDELNADHAISQALASYPIETVCLEILGKGLSEIGYLWYSGKSTVQQEHFASSLAVQKLDALISSTPPHTRSEKILLGCPAGEEHTFSLLLISLFLKRRGFDVIYLGANVPIDRFEKTISKTDPKLILLTAMMLHTAASLFETANFLLEFKVQVVFGGSIFNQHPELINIMPGHYLGKNLDHVVETVEKILSSRERVVSVQRVPDSMLKAHELYIDIRPQLEAHLWENIKTNGFKRDFVHIAIENFGRDIQAALVLGDLYLLNDELSWLQTLIKNHQVNPEYLEEFLNQYEKGLENFMDERGAPILEWFKSFLTKEA